MWSLLFALTLQDPVLLAPPGFTVDLVAQAPEILWPSANLCLDDGSLLVGEDPMDMIGPADQPIDRLVRFQFLPDGSKRKTVFAERLYAIFGLEAIDGAVYVMNMPHLTVLWDRDRDGVAEERRELLTDLGPPAPGWPGGFNDHIVSGIRLHHDGYLYVAVGDKGVPKAHGTDGSTLSLRGGGIVRLRPDGSGLELVASGLRNILDVAIDAQGAIFTHDNTDDGLGWWTRLTHIVPGGHYGYPWDYQQHPERMLPAIRDYGGGSPTGGLVYREAAWPAAYRGSLFFCEWAKQSLRRFELEPEGSTWKVKLDEDFLRAGDVREFRPTDVCESPDGRFLYVSDWGYGGWTNPAQTGRIWRVRRSDDDPRVPSRMRSLPNDTRDLLNTLGDPSYRRRHAAQRELARRDVRDELQRFANRGQVVAARMHALWALAANPEPGLHLPWESAGPGLRTSLAAIWKAVPSANPPAWTDFLEQEPAVRRAIALASAQRVPTQQSFEWWAQESDPWVRRAWIQAWREEPQVWRYPESGPRFESLSTTLQLELLEVYRGCYRAGVEEAWSLLYGAIREEAVRWRALEILAELCRKPAEWDGKWWSIQPARTPRPKGVVAWEGTAPIAWMFQRMLESPDTALRAACVRCMQAVEEPSFVAALRERVAQETDAQLRRAMVETLLAARDGESQAVLLRMALDETAQVQLRVDCLRALSQSGDKGLRTGLTRALSSPQALVRAAALRGLTKLFGSELLAVAREKLSDPSVELQRAALELLAQHGAADDAERALALAGNNELRLEITRVLERCAQPRSLDYLLVSLESSDPAIAKSANQALSAMRDAVRAELERRAQAQSFSPTLLSALRKLYSEPQPIVSWELAGPFPRTSTLPSLPELLAQAQGLWKPLTARSSDGFVNLEQELGAGSELRALVRKRWTTARAHQAQLSAGSDDMLSVWLDGQLVHDHQVHRAWSVDADRIALDLSAGEHELVLCIGQAAGQWSFNAKLSSEGSGPLFDAIPAQDPSLALREYLATHRGDPAKGWRVFQASQSGAMCIRCHRVHGQGAEVGPDLSDIAAKYSAEEILNSILRPSQRIAEGYKTMWMELADGRMLFGQLRTESDRELQLFDANGMPFTVEKAEIAERGVYDTSLMPGGLWKTLSHEQFADLYAWLLTNKGAPK